MTANILLIVLDSIRARNCSLYEYDRETTPFLESFAERSVLYEQARSPGVGSAQSHTSMFTGLHVHEHFINSTDSSLLSGNTVWEELSQQGYETGVFSSNTFLTEDTIGLNTAFGTVAGIEERLPFPKAQDPGDYVGTESARYQDYLSTGYEKGNFWPSIVNGVADKLSIHDSIPFELDADSRTYTNAFVRWHQDCSSPWAACINYMDAHTPFHPRREHNHWGEQTWETLREETDDLWECVRREKRPSALEEMEDLYDDCIHQVDAEIRRLVEYLESVDELEDTLLVITSDHGEGFGEAGMVRDIRSILHGTNGGIEEGLLHVPLVVNFPKQDTGKVITEPASLTKFRSVVKSTIEGENSVDGFVPEGPVVASALGLSDAERSAAPAGFEIPPSYEKESKAVYLKGGSETVLKYATVGEASCRFDCTDPLKTVYIDDDIGSIVEEVFGKFSQSPVVEHTNQKITGKVYSRLKELGYR